MSGLSDWLHSFGSSSGQPPVGGGSAEQIEKIQNSQDLAAQQIQEVLKQQKELFEKQADIQKAQKDLEKFQKAVEKKLLASLRDLKKDFELNKESMEANKVNLIEIVGIFVAIFTFVSVQIKILQEATSFLRIAGLSVLLFSGLSLFIYILFLIGESWLGNFKKRSTLERIGVPSMGLLLCFLGVGLVAWGDWANPSEVKNSTAFINLKTDVDSNAEKLQRLSMDFNERGLRVDQLVDDNRRLKQELEALNKILVDKQIYH